MQSMTGYGRSDVHDDRLALTIEAKSVNHRYLDVAWHYPRTYAPLEARMKQLVSQHFARGRIDIRITLGENGDTSRTVTPDFGLAQQYYEALRELQHRLGAPGTVDMSLLMGPARRAQGQRERAGGRGGRLAAHCRGAGSGACGA